MSQEITPVFTATEQRLMAVFADHLPHRSADLVSCLCDPECGSIQTVLQHISNIRTKIRPLGHDILCVIANRKPAYRLAYLREPVAITADLPSS